MKDYEDDSLSLTDAIDNGILMHRDAHFGGKFDIMLDYYGKGGRGAMQEFDIERIRELAELEKRSKQNLAASLLSASEAESVARAREAYRKLRTIYEGPETTLKKYPRLIADLILAEEDELDAAVQAIIAEKAAIVPALVELLRSEDYHDPLFPGYGMAPASAMLCLSSIPDKRALIALFESIGESDFFDDELALDALEHIGAPAKEFLLRVLHGKPITFDNERAAMALIRFKDDPEVVNSCFKMLKELDLKGNIVLATDLVLICEGLKDPNFQNEFVTISKQASTPNSIRQDMQSIAKSWKTNG